MQLSDASIMRFVSRLAAEGYLVSDGGKPMRYRVSERGRADLAVAA
jgi:DNA-binding transcriptional regulator PaaX